MPHMQHQESSGTCNRRSSDSADTAQRTEAAAAAPSVRWLLLQVASHSALSTLDCTARDCVTDDDNVNTNNRTCNNSNPRLTPLKQSPLPLSSKLVQESFQSLQTAVPSNLSLSCIIANSDLSQQPQQNIAFDNTGFKSTVDQTTAAASSSSSLSSEIGLPVDCTSLVDFAELVELASLIRASSLSLAASHAVSTVEAVEQSFTCQPGNCCNNSEICLEKKEKQHAPVECQDIHSTALLNSTFDSQHCNCAFVLHQLCCNSVTCLCQSECNQEQLQLESYQYKGLTNSKGSSCNTSLCTNYARKICGSKDRGVLSASDISGLETKAFVKDQKKSTSLLHPDNEYVCPISISHASKSDSSSLFVNNSVSDKQHPVPDDVNICLSSIACNTVKSQDNTCEFVEKQVPVVSSINLTHNLIEQLQNLRYNKQEVPFKKPLPVHANDEAEFVSCVEHNSVPVNQNILERSVSRISHHHKYDSRSTQHPLSWDQFPVTDQTELTSAFAGQASSSSHSTNCKFAKGSSLQQSHSLEINSNSCYSYSSTCSPPVEHFHKKDFRSLYCCSIPGSEQTSGFSPQNGLAHSPCYSTTPSVQLLPLVTPHYNNCKHNPPYHHHSQQLATCHSSYLPPVAALACQFQCCQSSRYLHNPYTVHQPFAPPSATAAADFFSLVPVPPICNCEFCVSTALETATSNPLIYNNMVTNHSHQYGCNTTPTSDPNVIIFNVPLVATSEALKSNSYSSCAPEIKDPAVVESGCPVATYHSSNSNSFRLQQPLAPQSNSVDCPQTRKSGKKKKRNLKRGKDKGLVVKDLACGSAGSDEAFITSPQVLPGTEGGICSKQLDNKHENSKRGSSRNISEHLQQVEARNNKFLKDSINSNHLSTGNCSIEQVAKQDHHAPNYAESKPVQSRVKSSNYNHQHFRNGDSSQRCSNNVTNYYYSLANGGCNNGPLGVKESYIQQQQRHLLTFPPLPSQPPLRCSPASTAVFAAPSALDTAVNSDCVKAPTGGAAGTSGGTGTPKELEPVKDYIEQALFSSTQQQQLQMVPGLFYSKPSYAAAAASTSLHQTSHLIEPLSQGDVPLFPPPSSVVFSQYSYAPPCYSHHAASPPHQPNSLNHVTSSSAAAVASTPSSAVTSQYSCLGRNAAAATHQSLPVASTSELSFGALLQQPVVSSMSGVAPPCYYPVGQDMHQQNKQNMQLPIGEPLPLAPSCFARSVAHQKWLGPMSGSASTDYPSGVASRRDSFSEASLEANNRGDFEKYTRVVDDEICLRKNELLESQTHNILKKPYFKIQFGNISPNKFPMCQSQEVILPSNPLQSLLHTKRQVHMTSLPGGSFNTDHCSDWHSRPNPRESREDLCMVQYTSDGLEKRIEEKMLSKHSEACPPSVASLPEHPSDRLRRELSLVHFGSGVSESSGCTPAGVNSLEALVNMNNTRIQCSSSELSSGQECDMSSKKLPRKEKEMTMSATNGYKSVEAENSSYSLPLDAPKPNSENQSSSDNAGNLNNNQSSPPASALASNEPVVCCPSPTCSGCGGHDTGYSSRCSTPPAPFSKNITKSIVKGSSGSNNNTGVVSASVFDGTSKTNGDGTERASSGQKSHNPGHDNGSRSHSPASNCSGSSFDSHTAKLFSNSSKNSSSHSDHNQNDCVNHNSCIDDNSISSMAVQFNGNSGDGYFGGDYYYNHYNPGRRGYYSNNNDRNNHYTGNGGVRGHINTNRSLQGGNNGISSVNRNYYHVRGRGGRCRGGSNGYNGNYGYGGYRQDGGGYYSNNNNYYHHQHHCPPQFANRFCDDQNWEEYYDGAQSFGPLSKQPSTSSLASSSATSDSYIDGKQQEKFNNSRRNSTVEEGDEMLKSCFPNAKKCNAITLHSSSQSVLETTSDASADRERCPSVPGLAKAVPQDVLRDDQSRNVPPKSTGNATLESTIVLADNFSIASSRGEQEEQHANNERHNSSSRCGAATASARVNNQPPLLSRPPTAAGSSQGILCLPAQRYCNNNNSNKSNELPYPPPHLAPFFHGPPHAGCRFPTGPHMFHPTQHPLAPPLFKQRPWLYHQTTGRGHNRGGRGGYSGNSHHNVGHHYNNNGASGYSGNNNSNGRCNGYYQYRHFNNSSSFANNGVAATFNRKFGRPHQQPRSKQCDGAGRSSTGESEDEQDVETDIDISDDTVILSEDDLLKSKEIVTTAGVFDLMANRDWVCPSTSDELEQHVFNHQMEVKDTPEQLLGAPEYDELSQQVWNLFFVTQQRDETLRKKHALRTRIYNVLQASSGVHRLLLVGSSVTGFGVDKSDVDLCLRPNTSSGGGHTSSRGGASRHHGNMEMEHLKAAYEMLKSCSWIKRGMEVIPATVPILRLTDALSNLQVDINVESTVGLRNTHLLHSYARCDWRVRPLVVSVKVWAAAQDINCARDGSISSYSLALMVIHYLQRGVTPPVLPVLHKCLPSRFNSSRSTDALHLTQSMPCFVSRNTAPLGQLFLGFLKYYSCFRYNKNALSVREGKVIPIHDCMRRDSDNTGCWNLLCIQEPFNFSNTARSVFNYMVFNKIKEVFDRSYKALRNNMNLGEIIPGLQPNLAVPRSIAYKSSRETDPGKELSVSKCDGAAHVSVPGNATASEVKQDSTQLVKDEPSESNGKTKRLTSDGKAISNERTEGVNVNQVICNKIVNDHSNGEAPLPVIRLHTEEVRGDCSKVVHEEKTERLKDCLNKLRTDGNHDKKSLSDSATDISINAKAVNIASNQNDDSFKETESVSKFSKASLLKTSNQTCELRINDVKYDASKLALMDREKKTIDTSCKLLLTVDFHAEGKKPKIIITTTVGSSSTSTVTATTSTVSSSSNSSTTTTTGSTSNFRNVPSCNTTSSNRPNSYATATSAAKRKASSVRGLCLNSSYRGPALHSHQQLSVVSDCAVAQHITQVPRGMDGGSPLCLKC